MFLLLSQRAQAALQAVNAVQSGSLALTGAPSTEGGLLPGQSSVLRIVVENLFYPVTLEVLYQVRRENNVFVFILTGRNTSINLGSSLSLEILHWVLELYEGRHFILVNNFYSPMLCLNEFHSK